jgi:hypothetical protein
VFAVLNTESLTPAMNQKWPSRKLLKIIFFFVAMPNKSFQISCCRNEGSSERLIILSCFNFCLLNDFSFIHLSHHQFFFVLAMPTYKHSLPEKTFQHFYVIAEKWIASFLGFFSGNIFPWILFTQFNIFLFLDLYKNA